ncbi:MAG: MBL fold metallo-hydrolase [Methanoregula sp.]|jgi:competence protein ComEC|uniref:MBL fold metallo-hydrolase n=1 Tax=Methanoregula sp. TaxID=2052170 RepID=UPI003C1624DC
MKHLKNSPACTRAIAVILVLLLLLSCAVIVGCTSPLSTSSGSSRQADNNGKLSAYFLDVGQGDSELLIFGNRTILIDAGETDMSDRVVADLQKLGVTRIDLLVATHSHSDHIGGMEKVLAAFPVGQVLDAGVPASSSIYEHFLNEIDNKQIPYMVAEQGQSIDLDPALQILVLSPPKQHFGDDPNANSVVLRISYGTINFLFTGDMGGEAEDALVKTGYPLDAQILKVGHHGSEYSTSKAFLARVHPEVAVIEVGKDNPYGHPHQATLQNLADAGVTVYRTDRDGTILVRSDGVSYSVTTGNGSGSVWTTTTSAQQTSGTVTATMETLSPAPVLPTPSPIPTVPTPPTVPPLPTIPSNISVPVTLPPVQIGNASSVYISATQFDAPGDDRANLNGEWVRIANRGDSAVLIAGWTLSDRTGAHLYVFPAVLLLPSTSVTVFTGSGTMNDTALYMGQTTPLFGNNGDVAILRDSAGTIIDQKTEDGTA